MQKRGSMLFYFLMFIAMIGWGAAWVHVKYLSSIMSVNEIIFYRYLLTTASMVPILLFFGYSFKIDRVALILSVIAGFLMALYTWLFIEGTRLGTASLGGAFVTTLIPIVTFLMLAFINKKKIRQKDIYALILGAIGVATILNIWSFRSEQIFKIENFYFIMAAFLWGVLTIIASRVKSINPLVYSFYIYLFTTLVEFLFVVKLDTNIVNIKPLGYLNILSLAFFSTTFATSIYFIGGQKIGADKISSFTFLVPFSAIALSAIFLGEKITIGMIIGTILAVFAIYILNKK